jgi:hypothetical protein
VVGLRKGVHGHNSTNMPSLHIYTCIYTYIHTITYVYRQAAMFTVALFKNAGTSPCCVKQERDRWHPALVRTLSQAASLSTFPSCQPPLSASLSPPRLLSTLTCQPLCHVDSLTRMQSCARDADRLRLSVFLPFLQHAAK